jgi:hypothetical protein
VIHSGHEALAFNESIMGGEATTGRAVSGAKVFECSRLTLAGRKSQNSTMNTEPRHFIIFGPNALVQQHAELMNRPHE